MKKLLTLLIENKFYSYIAILTIFIFGSIAYKYIGINFFPDSERPGVIILVEAPGMSSSDVERDISRPIERVCYSLDQIRKVSSINKDGLAVITTEFKYTKGVDLALLEVSNIINRVNLPANISKPMLFKTGDFIKAVMTLSVSSKNHALPLTFVRQIADNELKDALLTIPEVANVEVFGGDKREIKIEININKMISNGILPSQILQALKKNNVSVPAGININGNNAILIRVNTESKLISGLEAIPILTNKGPVYLKDIAKIRVTTADKFSSFSFNGEKSVAINILRNQNSNTLKTIETVKKHLPAIKKQFKNLDIKIADSQERMISLSITNLKSSLNSAIFLTVIVIFFLIGKLRVSVIIAISLPLTFLLSFILMWAFGIEFNLVTMSAIIISSGMLVDNNIVVSENIERHMTEYQKPLNKAIIDGTHEVFISIFSGTFSTILVLIPVMFLGGYVQRILRPLSLTLTITLVSSYIVAIWFVPVLFPLISGFVDKFEKTNKIVDKITDLSQKYFVDSIRDFFIGFFKVINKYKFLIVPVVILFFLSMMLMKKLVGRDLMPPMDTGIIVMNIRLSPDLSAEKSEKVLNRINTEILGKYKAETLSSLAYIGSEPGLISFGKARTQSDISITLNLVERFKRNKTIWEIENEIREQVYKIPEVVTADIKEFGSTPLSSIASPVDIQLEGSDFNELDKIAKEVEAKLSKMPGFTSVSRNWYIDKKEYSLKFNSEKCSFYGVTPVDVSYYLSQILFGQTGSVFRIENQDGLNIKLVSSNSIRGDINSIKTIPVPTKAGYIPLSELAKLEFSFVPVIYSRDNLHKTVHIQGLKATASTTYLDTQRDKVMAKIQLPSGITASKQGEIKQMKESFGRLGAALVFSVIFLFLSFVIIFKSFSDTIVVMLAIPFSFIGAVWGLLITGKHGCMPAFMGFILLIGVIVNNSILLVDFVNQYKSKFDNLFDAVKESVRVRTRPVLTTAVTTIVGMLPIAAERAFGLERMSPLAMVAIGGLFFGTFLTLVYTPTFFIIKEKLVNFFSNKTVKND
jgi:multidrug efflux pump subunit AcrB